MRKEAKIKNGRVSSPENLPTYLRVFFNVLQAGRWRDVTDQYMLIKGCSRENVTFLVEYKIPLIHGDKGEMK